MVRKSGSSSIKVCESEREVGFSLPPTHLFAVYSLVHSLCDTIFLPAQQLPAILHFTSRFSPPEKVEVGVHQMKTAPAVRCQRLVAPKTGGPPTRTSTKGRKSFLQTSLRTGMQSTQCTATVAPGQATSQNQSQPPLRRELKTSPPIIEVRSAPSPLPVCSVFFIGQLEVGCISAIHCMYAERVCN